MESLILAFIAGVCGKAFRDTIAHHYDRSIFKSLDCKWIESDWRNKPQYPNWRYFIPPLWDGWHFGDFVSVVGLAISIYLNPALIIYSLIMFYTSFTLFYHYIFIKKEKK